jgi:hypothetical protein
MKVVKATGRLRGKQPKLKPLKPRASSSYRIWALTPRPNSPTSSGSRSTIYRTLDGMRRNGDAGAAAADSDRQAGVAKGATLDVRSWMWDGYRWSKKMRTSALKRAGCSMFEA